LADGKCEKNKEKKTTMIGLQEMARLGDKEENKELGKSIMEMLDRGYFDNDEVNLWGTGLLQKEQRIAPMKPADREALFESVRNIPLREFLARSGTTGIAGAIYLIPTKVYQTLYDSAKKPDITADISSIMLGPEQIGGTTMNIDIEVDDQYVPKKYQSGGQLPVETMQTTQATLNFTEGFGINFKIANDLIEDSQFDVIEMHLRNAGKEMGEMASNEAVTILISAPDGDGTANAAASGDSQNTKFFGGTTAGITTAIMGNLDDGFVSDTLLTTHHAALHSIFATAGTTSNESDIWNKFTNGGWPTQIGGLNIVYNDTAYMWNTSAVRAFTCVFSKQYAMLTGRKRWLRIENYSDPVRDLTGATVTSRQDSVTIYKDANYTITETA